MDFVLLTVASLLAISVLGAVAGKLFPVSSDLNEQRVSRNLLRYEPLAEIERVFISSDKKTAIVHLNQPDKTFGLLQQLGDRVVCRVVGFTDVETATWEDSTVRLTLQDFTQPTITLALEAADAAQVKAVIDSVVNQREVPDAA